MAELTIVAIAGSLRRASYNRGLIRAAAANAPAGTRVRIVALDALPMFNQDLEDLGEPETVTSFKLAIERADALLVATPEYNHGVPGVLKNAIDWHLDPGPAALSSTNRSH
jgi:chromate reductase, NAD(P)H dehydrogenase (quinone)